MPFFVDFPDTYTGNFLDYNGELQNLVDAMVTAGLTPDCELRFTFNGAYRPTNYPLRVDNFLLIVMVYLCKAIHQLLI